MAMGTPAFEPELWNRPEIQGINNCYNYATNRRFEPGTERKYPAPAEPGRASGVTVGVHIGYDVLRQEKVRQGGATVTLFGPAFEITCDGLKSACVLDGLKEPTPPGPGETLPSCETDCYLVAYYVRPAQPFGTRGALFFSADYHFVRRDSDGNWSHKPATQEATRKQYKRPDPTVPEDPAKPDGTYTGDDITDPSKDSVGPGYRFCGYLCVCDASVRVAQADIPQTGRQSQGAIMARGTAQASTARVTAILSGTDFVSLLEDLTTWSGATWRPGYGEGQLRYRLDVGDRGAFTEFSLLVNDRSLTAWDGSARTLADPKGRLGRLIDAWFERRARTEPDLGVARAEHDAPQREQEVERRDS
jgi:hypothetical protein